VDDPQTHKMGSLRVQESILGRNYVFRRTGCLTEKNEYRKKEEKPKEDPRICLSKKKKKKKTQGGKRKTM